MRKLLALLIVVAGAYGVWQLEMAAGSVYYGFVFAAVLFVAYAVYLEEIKDTSWHYQVAIFYIGERDLHKACKGKACPYWLIVVFNSIVIPIQYLLWFLYYHVFWAVFYYPFITLGWLQGFEPRTWKSVWTQRQIVKTLPKEEQRFFKTIGCRYFGWFDKNDLKRGFPNSLVVIGLALVGAIVLLSLGAAGVHTNFKWAGQLGWGYGSLAGYGLFLGLILLGNAWVNYGWPTIKWVYAKSCPNVKFVTASRQTAKNKPQEPTRANA